MTEPYDTPADEVATPVSGEVVFPTLKFEDTGRTVRNLQALLLAAGHYVYVDGYFGAATEDELKKHQNDEGLEADGVAGPITFRNLLGV